MLVGPKNGNIQKRNGHTGLEFLELEFRLEITDLHCIIQSGSNEGHQYFL